MRTILRGMSSWGREAHYLEGLRAEDKVRGTRMLVWTLKSISGTYDLEGSGSWYGLQYTMSMEPSMSSAQR